MCVCCNLIITTRLVNKEVPQKIRQNSPLIQHPTPGCAWTETELGSGGSYPHPISTAGSKTWKQPSCPAKGEWMEKTWSVHTVESRAASRKKKIVSFATPRMDAEGILLNEINQREKDKLKKKKNSLGRRKMIPDENIIIQKEMKRTRKDKNVVDMWVNLMNIEFFKQLVK